MNEWKFIPTKYEWKLYRNGTLYFTFGLGQTEFEGVALFKIDNPNNPQEVLDLVLELIFQMEEETGIYFTDEEEKWRLEETMFSVLTDAFDGVR